MKKTPSKDALSLLEELSSARTKSVQRVATETATHTVQNEKGEKISETKYKRTRRKTEPDFVKLYLADLTKLFNCHPRVLMALAKRMQYQTNIVSLSPRIRRSLASECGFKNVKSLNNAISQLAKSKLIKRIDSFEIMVDPYIFGKGTWERVEQTRQVFEELSDANNDIVKTRFELDPYVETGEDHKSDQEARDEFRAQCVVNEALISESLWDEQPDKT